MSKLIKYICSTCGNKGNFKTEMDLFKHGWRLLAYNIALNSAICVCPECIKAESVLDHIKEVKKEEILASLEDDLEEIAEIEDELLEKEEINQTKKKYLKFD
jgi:hypothetical protein